MSMDMEKMMRDNPAITDRKGNTLWFVKRKGRTMFCWGTGDTSLCMGETIAYARLKDVIDFTKEELEQAKIWDSLEPDIQKLVVENLEQVKTEVVQKMDHARKHKKKKYDFSKLPEFLKCKCGRETKANYYYLQKKADAKKIPLDDLVKSYQCQTCNPTKRKKKNA